MSLFAVLITTAVVMSTTFNDAVTNPLLKYLLPGCMLVATILSVVAEIMCFWLAQPASYIAQNRVRANPVPLPAPVKERHRGWFYYPAAKQIMLHERMLKDSQSTYSGGSEESPESVEAVVEFTRRQMKRKNKKNKKAKD